jgi:hypothetical protein
MGLQLADALASPTRYMTDFLKQRGWRLPATRLVIPNVAPPLPAGLGPALPGAPAQASPLPDNNTPASLETLPGHLRAHSALLRG